MNKDLLEPCIVMGTIAAVLLSIIICITIHFDNLNNLIAKEKTCYGKVLLNTWGTPTGEILALQACKDIEGPAPIVNK